MPNPFSRESYKQCCNNYPRFTKEDGKWWAVCPLCRWAVQSKNGLPEQLAESWNATFGDKNG